MAFQSKKSSQVYIHPYFFSFEKRFWDIVLSSLGLLVASPLLVSISIGIVLSSGLPIFFVQKRIGKDKKPFKMYKFRTMYVGADADQKKFTGINQAPEPMFKIFDDPRFVGIGHFLSSTGLDELPQFWNVLRGEMSIVGPRPLPKSQTSKLDSQWQFRFAVKPGIFSQWTISSKRHESKKSWLELERNTLKIGSIYSDLVTVVSTLLRKKSKNQSK